MNDLLTLVIIVAELAFLAYAIVWFAKELREWKKSN